MNIKEIIKRLRYKAENIKAKLEPEYFAECATFLEEYESRVDLMREAQNGVIDLQQKTIELLEEQNQVLKEWLRKVGVNIEDDRK